MIGLDGKVCIVTGSARGIGRAVAVELSARGARVVVNDIDEEALDAAVADVEAAGGAAIAVAADVGTVAGGRALTEAALEAWGRVDVLVNNAGFTRDALLLKMTEAQWDSIMAVHNKALFACTQPVVQHLAQADGGGSIINVSSTAGLAGNLGQTHYATAKAGVLGFTLALAKEVKRHGTRVNAVVPTAWTRLTSAVPEELLVKHLGEEGLRSLREKLPEHVAPVVAFLASDAARHLTGQLVRASGTALGLMSHPQRKATVEREAPWTAEAVAVAFEQTLSATAEPLRGLGEL